jgi:transposase
MVSTDLKLDERIKKVVALLNEKQRRQYLAIESEIIGHGGLLEVSKVSGLSRKAIIKGKKELLSVPANENSQNERIRKEGGGRKNLKEKEPGLIKALELLLEPVTRGHPETVLKWTCLSMRTLSNELKVKGYTISHTKLGELLKELGFSLQSNSKRLEGGDHPDRNGQFLYINDKANQYITNGLPAISVDTKKKELVGQFKNTGKEYRPKKSPRSVNVHDFGTNKAAPYGIYDIGKNEGFVNVGVSSDTSEFAVFSIKEWWKNMGKSRYGEIGKLLITADGGGSNSSRTRLWKTSLQQLANELDLEVTVCHFPPGTSKWNKIEHRLFSYISMNWKGQPLVDYETVVQLIGAVTTKTGLKVKSQLDLNTYEKGKKVSDEELQSINIHRHEFHGEWNYTIKPQKK